MNKLIDQKQAVTTLFFITLPGFVAEYISYGMAKHNSGYLINFVICCAISFFLFAIIKKSFNKKINVYVENSFIEKTLKFIFTVYIVTLTFYNYSLCTDASVSVTSGIFSKDIMAFLPVLAALVCSVLGIETISRVSYVMFYAVIFVVIFMCLITIKGWQSDNFYPIFGTSLKTTFSDFKSVGIFLPALCSYLIRDNIKEPVKTFSCLKNVILYVGIFCALLLIICILTVPYPMITLYKFSLESIFSVAKSNVFFHRFELLLVFLLTILNTVSLSAGVFLSADLLSKSLKSNDQRPFCLVLILLMFYLNLVMTDSKFIKNINNVFAILTYVFMVIKAIILCFKNKNVKRARH